MKRSLSFSFHLIVFWSKRNRKQRSKQNYDIQCGFINAHFRRIKVRSRTKFTARQIGDTCTIFFRQAWKYHFFKLLQHVFRFPLFLFSFIFRKKRDSENNFSDEIIFRYLLERIYLPWSWQLWLTKLLPVLTVYYLF